MSNLQPNVLIVEDEPPLVELLSYNLEKAGFQAQIARDGDEALLAVEERRPDLVLLDWMLPYVSGIEICRRLRRNPETRDLPIILLTARGEEDDRIRGLEAGADDYVVKPFSPSELVARVRQAVVATWLAYGAPFEPRASLRDTTPAWPELIDRAAASGSVHTIKLIDALARCDAGGDPLWRSIAVHWFEWE